MSGYNLHKRNGQRKDEFFICLPCWGLYTFRDLSINANSTDSGFIEPDIYCPECHGSVEPI